MYSVQVGRKKTRNVPLLRFKENLLGSSYVNVVLRLSVKRKTIEEGKYRNLLILWM